MTTENQTQRLSIRTSDGQQLSATFYPTPTPRGAVFLFGAMGVPQTFYRPFAQFLTEHHYSVITFDPRGMGQSLSGPLAEVKTDILTWSRLDAEAVLSELSARAPGVPLTWLGHSLGGQVFPLAPSHEKVSKFITVASGSGWWRDNAPALKRRVWLLWFGFVPLLTPLFGYFPGERLKMVGDLPKGVILQWRRWCLHPEYHVGVEGEALRAQFASLSTPITSLSFSDDEMMSKKNISALHACFTNAPKKMLHFTPAQLERKRIGHFGFFRSEHRDLWQRLVLPELC